MGRVNPQLQGFDVIRGMLGSGVQFGWREGIRVGSCNVARYLAWLGIR